MLFFIFFAAGSGGIILLKGEGLDQFVVTSVPIAVLLFYALAVGLVPALRLPEDQAGDNCYYLGFLFTLVSLSIALASFVSDGGTEQIVEDFGIALASTITGLVLRVLFSQMRRDPVDVEREARLELAEATQRLRSELDLSVLEMNSFRRSTQQSISDGLQEFNAKVGELLEGNLARYDEVTSRSAERIDATLASFAGNAERLSSLSQKTAAAVEALAERIEAIRAPGDLVETKLAPAVDAVAELVVELKERADAESEGFHELREAMGAANSASVGLERQATAVAEVLKDLGHFGEVVAETERCLGALARGLDGANQSLSGPARGAEEAIATVARMATKLQEVEKQLGLLPTALQAHIEALSSVREEFGGLRRIFSFGARR